MTMDPRQKKRIIIALSVCALVVLGIVICVYVFSRPVTTTQMTTIGGGAAFITAPIARLR